MKVLFIILSILSLNAKANPALTNDFIAKVKASKIGDIREQAYCYDQANAVDGYQVDKLQRIASVTKLFTTYLASENLDLHKTYKTKLYISDDSLHIEGGRDPYFEEDKMILLMKALNELGYSSFKKVTFDSQFYFYDKTLDEFEIITPEKTRARLAYFMNARNRTALRALWPKIKGFAEEEGVDVGANPGFVTASSVQISVNPLLDKSHVIYVHESRPLHLILKSMNVQSKNLVAENIYVEGNETKNLSRLLVEENVPGESFSISNGSGLPINNPTIRFDNLASCRTVLKLMTLLTKSLEKHQLILSDVVAVSGGQDLGSFRTRFRDFPYLSDSVLSKTGTLMQTSTLAGMLLMGESVPFAILNHTTQAAPARKFQDRFVASMFDHLGSPTPMIYQKISIFPWDGSAFLVESY